MGDMKEYFDIHKKASKSLKVNNLNKANLEGWEQHTPYHWYRFIGGEKLDYWPSKNKWRFKGKTTVGDINKFLLKESKKND